MLTWILVIFYFISTSFWGFVPLKVLMILTYLALAIPLKGTTIFELNCIHVVTSVCILETASQSYTVFRLGLELQWFWPLSSLSLPPCYSYSRLPSASFLWQTCYLKTVLCKFRLSPSESESYGEEDEREYFDLTLEDAEIQNLHCIRCCSVAVLAPGPLQWIWPRAS